MAAFGGSKPQDRQSGCKGHALVIISATSSFPARFSSDIRRFGFVGAPSTISFLRLTVNSPPIFIGHFPRFIFFNGLIRTFHRLADSSENLFEVL